MAGHVRAEAIAVMNEIGIDISGHRSKHVDEFAGQDFDCALTVCDSAKKAVLDSPVKRSTCLKAFKIRPRINGACVNYCRYPFHPVLRERGSDFSHARSHCRQLSGMPFDGTSTTGADLQLPSEELRALGYRIVDMLVEHDRALRDKPVTRTLDWEAAKAKSTSRSPKRVFHHRLLEPAPVGMFFPRSCT